MSRHRDETKRWYGRHASPEGQRWSGGVKRDAQPVKIGEIAGREDEIARQAGGGDQRSIAPSPRPASSTRANKTAAGVGDFSVHRHDAPLEAHRRFLAT